MVDQIGIALTGVVAIFLTQLKDERLRRYACLFGIAGQPFWFYASITAGQWGITILNFLYAAAWMKGLWMHWIKDIWDARQKKAIIPVKHVLWIETKGCMANIEVVRHGLVLREYDKLDQSTGEMEPYFQIVLRDNEEINFPKRAFYFNPMSQCYEHRY